MHFEFLPRPCSNLIDVIGNVKCETMLFNDAVLCAECLYYLVIHKALSR
jgi:hypothetical protein